MIKKYPFLTALLAAATLTLTSCGSPAPQHDNVAIVNGAPISADEFAREASMASERYPEIASAPGSPGSEEALKGVLDSLILKKLMIQEAASRGLSEDKEFLNTIKMFWEQTLIKKLIDTRTSELAKTLSVSDEEAQTHWRRMGGKLTLLVVRAESEDEAERIKGEISRGERPEGAEVVGPLLIENLSPSDPLCPAFDMEQGQSAALKAGDGYLSVKVIRKDRVQTPPFAAISDDIKQALLERKKEQAFNDWLDGVKRAASVKIDRGALERAVK